MGAKPHFYKEQAWPWETDCNYISFHISLVTFYCSQPGHSDWTWRQILDHEVLDKWLETEWERAFIGGGEFSDVVHLPLIGGKASARSKASMNACAHPCELLRLPISQKNKRKDAKLSKCKTSQYLSANFQVESLSQSTDMCGFQNLGKPWKPKQFSTMVFQTSQPSKP